MKKAVLLIFSGWVLVLVQTGVVQSQTESESNEAISSTMSNDSVGATSLVAQIDGTIYDADLNIYWLADVNLAATNTFGITSITQFGEMDWNTAHSWISAMNSANYLGYNDWRLPKSEECTGYANCDTVSNEMAHLFYSELGGVAFQNLASTHNTNYALFHGGDLDWRYWYGTSAGEWDAYFFDFSSGNQGNLSKNSQYFVLAVRPGPVPSVSIQSSIFLLLFNND